MAARRLRSSRGAPLAGAVIAAASPIVCACNPALFIGSDDEPDANTAPIDFPWSTSFEDGDADYTGPQGFCYAGVGASVTTVDAPVHSGQRSAAFTVQADGGGPFGAAPSQVRCVRQGILPQSAYYGAWYYVPKSVTVPASTSNLSRWNLFHFEGADAPSGTPMNLWDLSLYSTPDGGLHVYGFDFQRSQTLDASAVGVVPLDNWVHFEVFFKRSDNDAGEFTIYQDGQLAADVSGISTDPTQWGKFFVGSLASTLIPPDVTVFVDDVSITPVP
jgi:hypothetical protein